MKEIKAIIRPFRLLEVIEALQQIKGLPGVTISETIGFGKNLKQKADDEIAYEKVLFVPRTKLEVVVADRMVDEVVKTIQKFANTGKPGDGNIFVINVNDAVRIRTDEHGEEAV